eukprot:557894-Heterocapsa_arctica.AAC.1
MSSMDALIRGLSGHEASLDIIADTWAMDTRSQSSSWYDRVPSPSNFADGPSRGECDELLRAGATQRSAVVPLP